MAGQSDVETGRLVGRLPSRAANPTTAMIGLFVPNHCYRGLLILQNLLFDYRIYLICQFDYFILTSLVRIMAMHPVLQSQSQSEGYTTP